MIKIFNPIKLDVARPNDQSVVLVKQGDMNSRYLIATICLNGDIVNIPKNALVKLNVIRADNIGASFSGTVMDDGRVTLPIDRWICMTVGDSRCSVEISHDDQVLTTMKFTVRTEESDDVNDLGEPEVTPTDPEYDAVLAMIDDYKNGRFGVSDIFIRYSAFDDGEGFTEKWSEGQKYIGIACGKEAPTEKDGFIWSRFSGNDGNEVRVVSKKGDSEESAVSQKLYTDGFNAIESRFEQKISENRLDMSAITENVCLKASGEAVESPQYRVTDYIPVKQDEVIRFYAGAVEDGIYVWKSREFFYIAAYDIGKNVLVDRGVNGANDAYAVPSGVSYVRITLPYNVGYIHQAVVAGISESYSPHFQPYLGLKSEMHDEQFIRRLAAETFGEGEGVRSIEGISEYDSGVLDGRAWKKYLVNFTDGTYSDFTVTDGKDGVGIISVNEAYSPDGIHDVTLQLTDDRKVSFRIKDGENGVGITSVHEENPTDGIHDIYVNLTNGENKRFRLRDGVGIISMYEGGTLEGVHDIIVELSNGDDFNFRVYDGVTPHVGENGNWWLGNTDTGVIARGDKGDTTYVQFKHDGKGNVTLTADHGSVDFTDDGNGNINLEVK